MSGIQLHDEQTGTTEAMIRPIRRRRRWGWWVASAVAVALVAFFVFGSGGRDVEPVYITETATLGDLEDVVEGTGVAGFGDGDLIPMTSRVGGTVTDVHVVDGATIAPMSAVIDIDDRTLWAVTGAAPLYRDLAVNVEGSEVETLEHSLDLAGYDVGEVDTIFDAETEAALKEWQEDNELDITGIFEVADFLWVPDGSTVLDVVAIPGAVITPGDQLVTAGVTAALLVRVTLEQADVTSLRPGDDARIGIDGIDGVLTGSVISISQVPVEDASYEALVSLDDSQDILPGMEASVTIVIDTLNDVVLIPTGALSGTASAPTVDVLVDGEAVTRPITTGLTTPTRVEVTSGISEGDQIVIGRESE